MRTRTTAHPLPAPLSLFVRSCSCQGARAGTCACMWACFAAAHLLSPIALPLHYAGRFPGTQYHGSRNLLELNAFLREHVMVRRTKDDVARELPEKERRKVGRSVP